MEISVEEFKKRYSLKTELIEKYSIVYLLISDVLNINRCESIVKTFGFSVERITKDYKERGILYSKVFYNEKEVAYIGLQGFPTITFHKRQRKLAKLIVNHTDVISPIPGIHRILEWHSVKDKKLHCLAGGETVIHVLPAELNMEILDSEIKRLKLEPLMKEYGKTN